MSERSEMRKSAMWKSTLFLGLGLLVLNAGIALAQEAPDVEAIRRDIERNGWSFEVDDSFSGKLTPEQRMNLRGFNPPPDYQKILDANLRIYPVQKDLPTNLDWRELGGVTPVKNQADCGSCWAFAAVGELESFIKIYYGVETDLSEQQVVSCNPYGAGCDGGWANAAYFVFQQYGAVQENCMPYMGMDPPEAPCDQNLYKKYGFIDGWNSVSNNVEQIKAALQYGPLCTAIDASDEFEAYSSGCYDVPGGWTNHLVLIVGYDDRSCDGNGAWIIKNSWGPDFGEGGYIHVQYGAGSVGVSLTQLQYTAPQTSIEIHPAITVEPIYGDQMATINWTSGGASAPYVDIWFGSEGHCHEYLVAENVPNTGSYEWAVPNLGTNYGSLVVHPSTGTPDGFGFTQDQVRIIGHKTRYVSPTGGNVAPYETPETAARSIADAVTACTGTDSVMVAGGSYVGTVSVGTTVRLFGGFSSDFSQRDPEAFPTVIQSGSTGMRFTAGSGDFGMADGFIFRNCTGGNSSEPVSGRHGGAIYVKDAAPVISNCVFEDNRADPGTATGFGGAICVVGGQPTVSDCVFTGNIASRGGAVGVFAGAEASFSGCDFTANSCSDSMATFLGAGFYVEGAQVSLDGGRLVNNGGSGSGGGMFLTGSAGAVLDRVEVRGNRANGNGGGFQVNQSQLTLRNLEVLDNRSATGSGGGIGSDNADLAVRNVRVAGNSSAIMGGGVFASNLTGVVENCLIQDNTSGSGGGMVAFSGGPATVRNNIVTGNSSGLMAVGTEMTAGHNNVWQNNGADYVSMTAPASDISADPLFVVSGDGGYGLGQFSPCIDRGADDAGCLDPDGSRADMGLLGGPAADFVAPAFVAGATLQDLGGGTWRLSWDAGAEPDITHYVVYRDTTEVFEPSPLKALATVEHPATSYEDTPGMDCYYLVVAVDADGHSGGYSAQLFTDGDVVTPAGDSELPRSLAIAGVVPNPFNPRTTLSYDVPRTGRVRLAVFDIRGRLVRELVNGTVAAGRHTAVWDGRDRGGQSVAAGVYFARMEDGRSATTAKMVLAK
jgi:cathepsin K